MGAAYSRFRFFQVFQNKGLIFWLPLKCLKTGNLRAILV